MALLRALTDDTINKSLNVLALRSGWANTMTTIRLITWAFIILVGGFTLYLGYMNRASERVASNLPTALAISAVGALLTLLFTLQPESRASAIPVEYVIDPKTLLPYSCEFFPDMLSYSDPGYGQGSGHSFTVVGDLAKKKPSIVEVKDDAALGRLYRDVLVRQMLDVLRFVYLKSWDAEPSRFVLPTGGGQTTYAARTVRQGVRLSNAQLVSRIGDPVADSDTFEFLNLPPKTVVHGEIAADRTTVEFRNPFVMVEVTVLQRGVTVGLGRLRNLCRLSNEDAQGFRRTAYEIRVEAHFEAIRAGHPDMPVYRHWVDVMFSELQRFDAQSRWDSATRDYLLLYANRTKSPMQELMEEAVRKSEGLP